ncbi:MAG: hypothetical protein K1X85_08450 [Ignavibacteria bacterium]|nr:hypothetical protein [Ignavibacteria bacterium]
MMKFFRILFRTFLFTFLIASAAVSQEIIGGCFGRSLAMRGLSPSDLSIPVNFDEEMSARAGFRLIIPLVRDMMQDPVKCFAFPDSLLSLSQLSFHSFAGEMFRMLNVNVRTDRNECAMISANSSLPELLKNFMKNRKRQESALKVYTVREKEFLKTMIMAVMSDAEDVKSDNTDIFAYNRSRDSSIAVSKRVVELLNKADRSMLFQMCIDDLCFMSGLYEALRSGKFTSAFQASGSESEAGISGGVSYISLSGGIRIVIGSKEDNRYKGHFDIIIDPGGNDIYELEPPGGELSESAQCIIDLGGNDVYRSDGDLSLASAFFGSSFIFDSGGDDFYTGAATSVASAICGLALIADEAGNDVYKGLNHSIGAATFGVGAVIDNEGNDTYIANSNSQGFGSTQGVGVIRDNKGNDSYIVDSRSLDLGRYEDHYISMCQGYGNGVRPYFAGGIGLLIESSGNDTYTTDIFGQGGAYWFSLGCIADKSGNDKYNSYQYGQGAGIHLAVGLLKDFDGWDFYSSNGVSQGCGHDYGFGLLHDLKGNDNYSAYSLSQGAGNANGVGILLDEEGRDGYLNKEPGNTRGYGNSRREYGSIGIFADCSGEDFYSVPGKDSTFNETSMWGGFLDEAGMPEVSNAPSYPGYKVPVDSSRSYSQEEFLIMAKTIEPRFQLWKEFGFRNLVRDSASTSLFILKYLDTEDHRVSLVLRDLAQKIGASMSEVFQMELNRYINRNSSSSELSAEQISFICYLYGETGDPSGKVQLLELSQDQNKRISISAVNALGKLRTDSSDTEFSALVASRLRELSEQRGSSKMLRKDIAFAFRKYKSDANIGSLINMLDDEYFASRFLSAGCLASYGSAYYDMLRASDNLQYPNTSNGRIAFYMSLENADEQLLAGMLDNGMTSPSTDAEKLAFRLLIENRSRDFPDIMQNGRIREFIESVKQTTNIRIF